MKTESQYKACKVGGWLDCPDEADCMGGQQAYLPAFNLTVTLRHEYDDQYVGVDEDGRDFIRESLSEWERYLTPEDVTESEVYQEWRGIH